ncbi:MAG: hypothetical protein J6N22_07995 [Schwartzia sp.]|nr:hypothetical protein [Schwartzia sp. (in: firmicutes)]
MCGFRFDESFHSLAGKFATEIEYVLRGKPRGKILGVDNTWIFETGRGRQDETHGREKNGEADFVCDAAGGEARIISASKSGYYRNNS